MLEAILLIGLLLLSSFFTASPVLAAIGFAVACALCIPYVRLILLKAPPFIPTRRADVKAMIDLAEIKPGDRACDLGCGDGRIVRAAAEKGAVSTGYELSLPTYLLAKALSAGTRNASVRYGDFWKADFADTDVVFCFLLKETMRSFEEKIWPQLKPGSRVVSYMFKLPGIPCARQEGNVYAYEKE